MSKKGKEHSSVKQFSLNGHARPVNMVRYNKDGDMFFTCSNDKNIIAWENETASKMGVYEGPSACKSLAISKHTEYVLGAFGMEGVIIFEAETGKEIFKFVPAELTNSKYLEFSQGDSDLLVLYSKDNKSSVVIYDFKKLLNKDKKVKKTFNFDFEVTQASFGYLNEKLYISTTNGKMKIIDISSESVEIDEPIHPGHELFSFVFSKDYSMLATCGKDHKWKLLHPETLEIVKVYDKGSPWRCASFSPLFDMEDTDKYHILIGGGQDARDVTGTKETEGSFETRLYHVIHEEEMAQIKGHFGPVHSIQISPDGRGFVTASEDGTVRLQRFPLDYY